MVFNDVVILGKRGGILVEGGDVALQLKYIRIVALREPSLKIKPNFMIRIAIYRTTCERFINVVKKPRQDHIATSLL